MSSEERQLLIQELIEELDKRHLDCPLGLTGVDVEGIRMLGKIARLGGGTAIAAGVTVIVTGLIGVFIAGVIAWIRARI